MDFVLFCLAQKKKKSQNESQTHIKTFARPRTFQFTVSRPKCNYIISTLLPFAWRPISQYICGCVLNNELVNINGLGRTGGSPAAFLISCHSQDLNGLSWWLGPMHMARMSCIWQEWAICLSFQSSKQEDN